MFKMRRNVARWSWNGVEEITDLMVGMVRMRGAVVELRPELTDLSERCMAGGWRVLGLLARPSSQNSTLTHNLILDLLLLLLSMCRDSTRISPNQIRETRFFVCYTHMHLVHICVHIRAAPNGLK